ncbi:sigma-70 family RNA polymerase sigma factor [Aeoliella sp.]|uniref:sigma-70 family RNA polymerase sigma factor n=1 Tax=Aeoliella sp. TaxID=2795800 RepID=UPI003CCBE874
MDHHQGDEIAKDSVGGSEIENFVHLLTESQGSLKAYLLAALGNFDDAAEVLQRTNLTLWRNAAKFRPGAEFMPWAVTLARYEVMSFYRDRSRDRHVFSEEVALLMLSAATEHAPDLDDRHHALRICLGELPKASQKMIQLRYEHRSPIAEIARELKRTEDAIKSALLRIRKSLANCILKRLELDSAP